MTYRPAMISVCLWAASALGGPTWQTDIGYTELKSQLGEQTPTGAGIDASLVEAPYLEAGRYLPDAASAEFSGKSIVEKSGPGLISPHASRVSRHLYGQLSSPAWAVDGVDCYEAGDWLGSGFLRTLEPVPPRIEHRRVQNHSWVETSYPNAVNVDILRRLDLVIDRDGVVVCAGVNNYNPSAPLTRQMPELVCSAYNCIAVGLTNLNSSYGPTTVDGIGRSKPDLVAIGDASLTSYATPAVGAAAALLLETQDRMNVPGGLPEYRQRSAKALLTKALLMGGAAKPDGWRRGFATPGADGKVPLDYRSGAGNLHVANSYHLLLAGQHGGSMAGLVPARGWDYHDAEAGSRLYFFEVPAGQVAVRLSIMLVWNRKVTAPPDLDRDDDVDADDFAVVQGCLSGPALPSIAPGCEAADFDRDLDVDQADFGAFQACLSGPGHPAATACRGGLVASVANLDLRLHAADGLSLGAQRDQSISDIDNVEHIYQENLPAGTWAIEVSSDRPWPYALTWDAVLAPASP